MYSGNWVFSLSGGTTYGFTDYKESAMGLSLRGAGEYFFDTGTNHIFSIKLFLSSEKISAEDNRGRISSSDSSRRYIPQKINTDLFSVGIGISYNYSINNTVFPFAGIGIANIWFDPKDGNGIEAAGNSGGLYKKSDLSFFVEGGFKFLVSRNLSLNISAGMQIALTDYLDDVAAGKSNDAYMTALFGVSFAPFMKSEITTASLKQEPEGIREEIKPPPVTEEVKKVEPEVIITEQTLEELPPETTKEKEVLPRSFTLSGDDVFNIASSQIKFEAKDLLDSVITVLNKMPDASWRIEGHMDSQGTERLIRTISFERARAILEYFAAFGGLDKSKFEIFGMGDKFPVGNNNTEEGRKVNRRIEIKLVE